MQKSCHIQKVTKGHTDPECSRFVEFIEKNPTIHMKLCIETKWRAKSSELTFKSDK